MTPQKALVQRHKEQVDLGHLAVQSTEIPFSMESLRYDTPLPNYIALQDQASLMINSSLVNISKQPFDSLERLLDVVRFGQDVGHTGPLIQSMVGFVISKKALNAYIEQQPALYQAQVDTSALLKQWQNLLAVHKGSVELAIKGEDVLVKEMLYSPLSWPEMASELLSYDDNESEQRDAHIFNVLSYFPAQQQAFSKHTRKLLQSSAYFSSKPTIDKSFDKNIFVSTFVPNLVGAFERENKNYKLLLTAYAQTALADYYDRYGIYPKKLSSLDNIKWEQWSKGHSISYQLNAEGYKITVKHLEEKDKTYKNPKHVGKNKHV